MSLYWIAIGAGAIFVAAFLTYGRFLSRVVDLKDERRTPAHELADGVDFVPTRKTFLLGQHFSAIAAAGLTLDPAVFRPSEFIDLALRNITGSLLLGGALVAVVLFLFLADAGDSP